MFDYIRICIEWTRLCARVIAATCRGAAVGAIG